MTTKMEQPEGTHEADEGAAELDIKIETAETAMDGTEETNRYSRGLKMHLLKLCFIGSCLSVGGGSIAQ